SVTAIDEADMPRFATGIAEFDRILGGGIVPGSAILVGGEPGIGKSTLLLQVANELARVKPPGADRKKRESDSTPRPILYVTSEESAQQTKLRASRLGASSDNLLVLA